MWKKSESTPGEPVQKNAAPPEPAPKPTQPAKAPPKPRALATIGPSITIVGDLKGKEDLLIEGKVDGTIQVDQHVVTIGTPGQVNASVYGKAVTVEGTVEGDLFGSDEIVIRKSGKVQGNLTAPRVSLEDGSTFRGSIDMSAPEPKTAKSEKPPATKAAS
ncbi:MAG: polymer-forming cytoskeletal protein [Acidobacteriota bacterium]